MMYDLPCPECKQETEHTVLKESADLLVQCTQCGHIYHIPRMKEPKVIQIRTIISIERDSVVGNIELVDEDICSLGDLLVAEYGDEAMGVEVTGIEVVDKRKKHAKASDITTLWTRMVEKVVVKVSVHDTRVTLPLYSHCDGEEDFIIGDIYKIDNVRFRVKQIKLRNGAMMRKEGWKAYARKIKRVYGIRV